MLALGNTLSGLGAIGPLIALEEDDLLEVVREDACAQEARHATADDDGASEPASTGIQEHPS
jgi:hypothetical protein